MSRPQNSAPDIGSVEVVPAPVIEQDSTITVGPAQKVNAGDDVVFTIERTNAAVDPWTGEVSVRVATTDGTAQAGTDYIAISETLVWGEGDTAPKSVRVQTHKRAAAGEKSFRLLLTEPSEHAVLGARETATGTILVQAVTPTDPTTPTPRHRPHRLRQHRHRAKRRHYPIPGKMPPKQSGGFWAR